MNTKTYRRHLRLPASKDAAIMAYADSHHKSVTWAIIQAIDLLTLDGRRPPTPSSLSQVAADIARMLQVSVFVANCVRELKAELVRQGDVRLTLGEAARLTDLLHQLDTVESTLTSLRRQLALHLTAMPAAKHTVRTNRRQANEGAAGEPRK